MKKAKELRICPVCGKPIPNVRGGKKPHAGFCTKVRRADYMRVYMRDYYRRKRHPPEEPVPEPEPSAPPQRLTLDQLAAKARSEGKTYGQLRAEMLLEQLTGAKQ